MRAGLVLALLLALPTGLRAESVVDMVVQFTALVYDDPADPYLITPAWTKIVARDSNRSNPLDGFILFDVMADGVQVVPAHVDVRPDRIDITYGDATPGRFANAVFNGYLIEFQPDPRGPGNCAIVTDAVINSDVTNIAISDNAVTVIPTGVSINLAGVEYNEQSRIGIELTAAACPDQ